MKNLSEQIKQALSAISYADAGEYLSPCEKRAVLSPVASSQPAAPTVGRRKWIAMGVGPVLYGFAMDYAIAACQRMNADLLLLAHDAASAHAQLSPFLDDLQGIRCYTEEVGGSSHLAVVRALQRHTGVIFAITGSQDDPVRSLVRGSRTLLKSASPVPVVVVDPKPLGKQDNTPAAYRIDAFHGNPVSQT